MNDALPTPLRHWLDLAWNDHPDAPARIAAELAQRAATLPDDADGAECVRLAEHVLLAHLADSAAMQALLSRLPPGAAALQPGIQRATWALAQLGDGAPPAATPDDATRWRALHSVLMVLVARGQAAQAQRRLSSEEEAAAAHPDAAARKAFAATANNTAADLTAGPRGDAARDALMLAAAAASRRVWQGAGNWMNVERADYRLALCHAALGQGSQAVAHAAACLALCEAEAADASELFFAHECNVLAQRAAGDAASAAAHREKMVALLAQIEDAQMQRYCSETLDKT